MHELGLDSNGDLYFTMRLVRGKSLKQFLEQVRGDRDQNARRRALEIVLKVCDTIAFAHANGVIHRDLKPSNVMLGDYGAVYVVDWGLAREFDRARGDDDGVDDDGAIGAPVESAFATLDGDVLGTPAYMPPEQAEGRRAAVGPHSDVYAIGAMLYHLIAGRAPFFEGDSTPTSHEVLARVLAGPPQPLASIADHAPTELVAIVERAMAREPGSRYADCSEMAADLRAFLELRVVRAHAGGTATRIKKWVQRNRALSVSLGVVTLLAIGGLFSWREASAKERDLAFLEDLRGPIELLEEFDTIWPISEEKRPALASWLARADGLRKRVPELERALDDLRANGKQIEQASWIQSTEELRLANRRRSVAEAIEWTRSMIGVAEESGGSVRGTTLDSLLIRLASLQKKKLELDARKPTRIAWNFEDPRTQLLNDRLEQFLAEFDLVCGRREECETMHLVRAALARFAALPSADPTERKRLWDDAAIQIASDPRYGGLWLREQTGLWPLGRDPRTGLWEFAHVASGAIPTRDSRGELQITADGAIVLVLVPPGHAFLGAQRVDPNMPCFDPSAVADDGPPIEDDFAAFFIGKYELTRAQWARLVGRDVAGTDAEGDDEAQLRSVLPAFGMSGERAGTVMTAYGLELPSSLRWEYAARAGSESAWWCGNDAASICDAGNVADLSWQRSRRWPDSSNPGPITYDDSFPAFAPIGSFRANDFGLHDTIGNVAEWCRDMTERRMTEETSGNELYRRNFGLQIARGGSFDDGVTEARSGARLYLRSEYQGASIGARASRSIQP